MSFKDFFEKRNVQSYKSVIVFIFFVCIGRRLRVSVLEAFDPLLLNDSSETTDQGKFINCLQKPKFVMYTYLEVNIVACVCVVYASKKNLKTKQMIAQKFNFYVPARVSVRSHLRSRHSLRL